VPEPFGSETFEKQRLEVRDLGMVERAVVAA
jgi:hypothetical protein